MPALRAACVSASTSVKIVKGLADAQYEPELVQIKSSLGGDGADMEKDELFDDAVRIVLETKRGSVSLLQRRLTIGIAQGAEGDIGGYLVSRHFDLKNYALIFSFVKSALDGGGAIGALILSYSLSASTTPATPDGSYVPFLLLCAATTLIGAILFFMTGRDVTHAVADDAVIASEAS